MAHCFKCNKDVRFRLEPRKYTFQKRGIIINFINDQAICVECGEYAYDMELQAKTGNKACELYLNKLDEKEKGGT